MTLVKIILDADGVTVKHHAWAHPNNANLIGKQDGNGYIYYDVTNKVDDPYTQGIDVPDGHAKLINGELVVDANYTPPVENFESLPVTPSAEMQAINALGIQFANYVESQKGAATNA